MDYKEKYEELVEATRAVVEGNPGLCDMNKRLGRVRNLLPKKESEDERIRKEIITLLQEIAEDDDYCGRNHCDEYIAWLEKQKEQQPAEWSEEDEKHLNWVIEHFRQSGELYHDLIDWLKSLRHQQKQEVVDRNVFYRIADILRWCDLPIGCPVENFRESESEREHLLEIVQCVAHRYANSCMYCKEYSRGYQDGLAVPHWKPSEEQMKSLNTAYRLGKLGKTDMEVLQSLYNDLSKSYSL